jgi:hypothetical protein
VSYEDPGRPERLKAFGAGKREQGAPRRPITATPKSAAAVSPTPSVRVPPEPTGRQRRWHRSAPTAHRHVAQAAAVLTRQKLIRIGWVTVKVTLSMMRLSRRTF